MYRRARAGKRTSTGESGQAHECGQVADKVGVPLTVGRVMAKNWLWKVKL